MSAAAVKAQDTSHKRNKPVVPAVPVIAATAVIFLTNLRSKYLMDMSNFLGGQFLAAADLSGKVADATISGCTAEMMQGSNGQQQQKPVLAFSNVTKRMVLNKTNLSVLCSAFGTDSGQWVGKSVQLYAEPTFMAGKQLMGLRLRPVVAAAPAAVAVAAVAPAAPVAAAPVAPAPVAPPTL